MHRYIVPLVLAFAAGSASEPVPVVKDPLHRPVLENAYVRVLDVRIPAGASSLYHQHTTPSAIVYLTDSLVGNEEWPTQPMTVREFKAGFTRYAPFHEQPQTHRVTNKSSHVFRALDVEIVAKPSEKRLMAVASQQLVENWNENFARSSTAKLKPGDTLASMTDNACIWISIAGKLQVSMRDGTKRVISPGEFQFIAPRAGVSISALSEVEAVVIEIK